MLENQGKRKYIPFDSGTTTSFALDNLFHWGEKTIMKRRLLALCGIMLAVSSTSNALPRFSSRMNLPCKSCHVNPSGGGMRNQFGQDFGREQLAVKQWQQEYGLEEFSTKISDFLSYGSDFRFLSFYQTRSNPDASSTSFFPMQMDLYLNLAVSKKISLYLNPAFGPYNRLEAFVVAKVLPVSGYIKAGRFAPPHGLRLDDHTSFIRQATPFRNNTGQQSGVEFGFGPSPFRLMGAVTNGMSGDIDGGLAKAVFGKVEANGSLGPVNLLGGISSYNDASSGEKLNLQEAYGAVTLWQRLTVIGTMERIQGNSPAMSVNSDRNQRNGVGANLKQLALMVEADYLLTDGVDFKLMYDFFDPNTDVKGGSATRYSAGIEFIPVSGVEVRPLLRYTEDTLLRRNITDLHVLFHIYL